MYTTYVDRKNYNNIYRLSFYGISSVYKAKYTSILVRWGKKGLGGFYLKRNGLTIKTRIDLQLMRYSFQ